MVRYRRNLIPGGTFFFTVTLMDRSSKYLVEHVDLLRESFRVVMNKRPYTIHAIVILPEHLHAIWQLPEGDADYSSRWSAIKTNFSRRLVKKGIKVRKNDRGEFLLWQRRFWEHTIRDDRDYQRHVDYIHFNPVKHGLVSAPCDWPFSSFHDYVEKGFLPLTWAGSLDNDYEQFGE